MYLKIILLCCVILALFGLSLGAPRPKDQDLKESFIEFLQQDKELSNLLAKASEFQSEPSLARAIRAAELDSNDFDESQPPPPNKDGFFDRAAKFVMEVLQRFLKWVNSDN